MLQIVGWWLLIQLLGLGALPLAYRLFRWLPGRGYAFAKPLGLLLTTYVLWLGASLGYLHNTLDGAFVAVGVMIGISLAYYLYRSEPSDQSLLGFLQDHQRLILTVEILFAVGFLAWAGLRAYAPDKIMSSGGEKFMEIAFLNGILQSPTFPPHDPWLSGFAISYYYFGYVMMALLTRLSGVLPEVGFELYDALMFALTLIGAFGVVHSLVASSAPTHADDAPALRFGLLGSLFVAVIGNLEGLLEAVYARGLLPIAFWRWIDIPDLMEAGQITGSWYPGSGWWWWRASRVIRDRNLLGEPMPLNPIDEFPFFSFLLGDNHPHVLALPFVLLSVALAYSLLRRQRPCERRQSRPDAATTRRHHAPWWNPVGYCLEGDWAQFGLCALALGALGFLNTWDFPTYLGLAVLAYGAGRYAGTDESVRETLQKMVVLGVGLTLAGIVLFLPFYIGFSSQAGGVVPYLLPPTRLAQFLVMFGPFVFVATWFLLTRLLATRDRMKVLAAVAQSWAVAVLAPLSVFALTLVIATVTPQGRQIVESLLSDHSIQQVVGSVGVGAAARAVGLARLRDPWLFLALSLLIASSAISLLHPRRRRDEHACPAPGTQFSSLLFLCGLGLTLVVEFVYLRDSFGVRMNTIFKFYYQAWVMLSCASAFGTWWILRARGEATNRVVQTGFLAACALLTASGLVYPLMASYSRVDGFRHRPDLNGAINIARAHPDDWAAIEWLRANAETATVILEAPGKSYNYEGRMSAFTGFPSVLGWALHESQWRGNYDEQGKREPDIETIYTTPDGHEALALLEKWQVNYVIAGPAERRYIEELCRAPERSCSSQQVLEGFDELLELVHDQGQTRIYRVPRS